MSSPFSVEVGVCCPVDAGKVRDMSLSTPFNSQSGHVCLPGSRCIIVISFSCSSSLIRFWHVQLVLVFKEI